MPVPLRTDFDGPQLRSAARKTKDGPQVRRLLSLAAIYDGASRTEAGRLQKPVAEPALNLIRYRPGQEANRMAQQPGFFDVDGRLQELSAKGDALERLSELVDFEMFRSDLERAVPRSDGSKGGRPAFDHVLMLKVLLLQAMHTLSDERCEYLIKDRLSFMRFLGLGLGDVVPDANTIWISARR